jgi:hypothetical protein
MTETAYAPAGAKRKAAAPKADVMTMERPPQVEAPNDDPIGKRIEEMRAFRKQRNTQDVSGFTQRLSVPENLKDKRLVYRWVNDTSTRLHDMAQKGWIHAESMDIAQDARNSGTGTRIERIANERTARGTPQKTFLMVKPREFYEEDKAAEVAKIKAHEQAINGRAGDQRNVRNEQGAAESGMYIPAGGMTIKHGN